MLWLFLNVGWRRRFGTTLIVLGIAGLAAYYSQATEFVPSVPAISLLCLTGGAALWIWWFFDKRTSAADLEPKKWELAANRAQALADQDRWEEALSEFRQAMTLAGPAPARLRASTRIGDYLLAHRKPAEAMPYMRDALLLNEQLYGRTHQRSMAVRDRFGDLCFEIGDAYSAAQVRRVQLELLAPSGTVGTLDAAHAATKLGEALQRQGDTSAAALAKQTAAAAVQVADPGNPQVVQVLVGVARLALGEGDLLTAEVTLNRAIQLAEAAGSADGVALARLNLLSVFMAAGRYGEAVPLSQQALDRHRRASGSGDAMNTVNAYREHARVLELAGNLEEAVKARRAADILERVAAGQR